MQTFQKLIALESIELFNAPDAPTSLRVKENVQLMNEKKLQAAKREVLREASGFLNQRTMLQCFQIPEFTSALVGADIIHPSAPRFRRFSGHIAIVCNTMEHFEYLALSRPSVTFKLVADQWLEFNLRTGELELFSPTEDPRGALL